MSKGVLDHKGVIAALHWAALFLELKDENPFKVKAYSNAARSIEILEKDLKRMIQEDRLKEIKGVGDTIAHHITELLTTGKLQLLEKLRNSIPPGHLEMLKIPRPGAEKIKVLLRCPRYQNRWRVGIRLFRKSIS